jgi:response regulator NasT
MLPAKAPILLCDDDRLVLATLASELNAAGFEVVLARDGQEALTLAEQWNPWLAILDIRMPVMSGFEVAQALRARYDTPFLFLSAYSDPTDLERARALQALDYLVKPVSGAQLVGAVTSRLEYLRSRTQTRLSADPISP